MPTQVINDWLSELRQSLHSEPWISAAHVGVFYTAVEISTGEVGVAFTPRGLTDTVCCPKSAAGAPPAGLLVGAKAWEIAEHALAPSPLRRALGVATLNALSLAAIAHHGLPEGVMHEHLDALNAVAIGSDDKVAMVGAFVPFIKKLKGKVAKLFVIDKHPEALKPEEHAFWMSPDRAGEVLEDADVAIFSGSVLVEGGTDELLEWAKGARLKIMAGPTTPLWSRPFFRRGIAVMGGIMPTDNSMLLSIVAEGGSGYLFERAARKVCVVAPVVQRELAHASSLAR